MTFMVVNGALGHVGYLEGDEMNEQPGPHPGGEPPTEPEPEPEPEDE